MFVGTGGNSEWVCVVDMGTAMSRTSMLQTHGSGKAFPWWGMEAWQRLCLIQVLTNDWPLSHSFLRDGCSLSLLPSRDLLPRLTEPASNKPTSAISQRYEINFLHFPVAAAGTSECTWLTPPQHFCLCVCPFLVLFFFPLYFYYFVFIFYFFYLFILHPTQSRLPPPTIFPLFLLPFSECMWVLGIEPKSSFKASTFMTLPSSPWLSYRYSFRKAAWGFWVCLGPNRMAWTLSLTGERTVRPFQSCGAQRMTQEWVHATVKSWV